MTFTKGNQFGVKGRPKGIKSQAQQLKAYLIKLLMTDKSALKKIPKKELLKCIAPLLPKEQTIHQDTEPITINIDTQKDEKTLIQSNIETNTRILPNIDLIPVNTPNNKVNEINGEMGVSHPVDTDIDKQDIVGLTEPTSTLDVGTDVEVNESSVSTKYSVKGTDTPEAQSESEEA